jgi:magnesium chelatase family protein
MSLAVVISRALDGLDAPEVRVEVQLANGLPSFTLVGLADTEVRESRERVRAALQQSGLAFPHNRRVTVNLAPADLPKESGRFDLPIASGILAAAGQIDSARLDGHEFAGELSLAGDLRPVRGAIALALGARRSGAGRALVLPTASASLAAHVPGVVVLSAGHLLEVVAAFAPVDPASATAAGLSRAVASPDGADARDAHAPDLRDVRGQPLAKRALEIAAAGGHHLLLTGPPGTGKSMLAQRLSGLLPPMADDEALASAALLGLAIAAAADAPPAFGRRPLRAPHHSASAVALVGGGVPPRPGEISLAHGGVLFLDELPEFPRPALEALREPLESGHISIARAARSARFPARFQLVAAMNPCPCGRLGDTTPGAPSCRCTPDGVARYRARLSGPLLDRIDLQVTVTAPPPHAVLGLPDGEPSAAVAERVAAARRRQLDRQHECNARRAPGAGDAAVRAEPAALQFLRQAAERLGWSARGLHRTLKVARTIADLADADTVAIAHMAEAVQFRRGPGG